MLLEEITKSDLTFLAKALSFMKDIGDWSTLDKRAYNVAALKEAVHLYNWALHENNAQFSAQYTALQNFIVTRSMPGVISALRELVPTGFVERNGLIGNVQTQAITKDVAGWKNAKQDANKFADAVRIVFYSLKMLANVVTPGNRAYNSNDSLNRKFAVATLKRLGVQPNNGSYYVKVYER